MCTRFLSIRYLLGLSFLSLMVVLSGCQGTAGSWNNVLGQRAYRQGDYTTARRRFERALMNNPWRADFAYNVAAAMQKQGDPIAAERMYDHAITLDPSHQPSYHSLASLLKEQGREEEAIELLASWSETQPYVPESQIEMAWYQQETGNLDAAEQQLEQAMRMYPADPDVAAQLGQVYERRGRRRRAAAMYRRSLAMRRFQPRVRSRLDGMTMAGQPTPALALAAGGFQPTLPMAANPAYAGMPDYPQAVPGSPQLANMPPRRPLLERLRERRYQRLYGYGSPMATPTFPSQAQVYSTFPTQTMNAVAQPSYPVSGLNAPQQMTVPAPWPQGTMPGTSVPQANAGTVLTVPQPHALPTPSPSAVTPGQPMVQGAWPQPWPKTAPTMVQPTPQVQLGNPIPITQGTPEPIPTMTHRLPVVSAF